MYIKLLPNLYLIESPYALNSMMSARVMRWSGEDHLYSSFAEFYKGATELSGYVQYEYADEDDVSDVLDLYF